MRRSALIGTLGCAALLALSAVSHMGCGSFKRPPHVSSVTLRGPALDQASRERALAAYAAYDTAGYPPVIVTCEIRPVDPQASALIGEPGIFAAVPGGSVLPVIAATYRADGVTICARTQERWLVHEAWHLGGGDDGHKDPSWVEIDRLARSLPGWDSLP